MKSKYAMTEHQVETLASEYAQATQQTQRVNTTYLRVLVNAMQSILGNKKVRGRVPVEAHLEVLNDVSTKFYAAVLRGVTTPDIQPDTAQPKDEQTRRSIERNRRSTFARSAKSTLTSYISAGGDVRALDVDVVTRDPLLAAVRATKGQTPSGYSLERHRNAILRLIAREAKTNPEGARADLEAAISALQDALDELSVNGNAATAQPAQPTITQVIRSRPAHARMQAPAGRAHA